MPSIKIYSKEQVDDLISGVSPPTVVQTTGTSTTSVMSQDAVTTALGNKADTSALPTSSQLVPSTSGASSGDVLSFNGTSTEWVAPSGGGGSYDTASSLLDLYNIVNGMSENQVIDIFMSYQNNQYCNFRGIKHSDGKLYGTGLNQFYVSSKLDMRTVNVFSINNYGAIDMHTNIDGTSITSGSVIGMATVYKILYKIIG